MERNKVSLKEHLLPHFAWNRGSLRICHLEESGWVCSIFLAHCHCVLTAQLNTGQCVVAWPAGPRLPVSGTGNFVLGKVILEIFSDLRETANKVVIFPLMAPACPAPAPELFPAQNCFILFHLFCPTHLLLKKIHWLHTYFIFLGCFYSFFYIFSMVSLFPSVYFSVLSVIFFSFFIPWPFFRTTPLASQVTSQN